ncbi:MAG: hypothetical protein NC907_05590, partial [Candidatus Omnitrophica bacterium]|nr:hypothetical protein [Candidatus Omnitrophota bacterium]
MKKTFKMCIALSILISISGYCQQEKSPSAFEVVEKVGARIQQIPDSGSIKNVTGSINFTVKLGESDYANLKSISEKIFGRVISNPVKLEGKFISLLPSSGGKIEKFMMSGKSEFGTFYFYRNLDDIVMLFPEIGIEIQDNISEIRKLSQRSTVQPPPQFPEGLSMLMNPNPFKTLFNQVKFWFYDATISSVEKSGKKLIELNKTSPEADVKIVVMPDTWSIAQITVMADLATIIVNYKPPAAKEKVEFIDYMPESITIEAIDKGNNVKIEFGSLAYNKSIDENLFSLKKMKLSEF